MRRFSGGNRKHFALLVLIGMLSLAVQIPLKPGCWASQDQNPHGQIAPKIAPRRTYLPTVIKTHAVQSTPNYRFGLGVRRNPIAQYDPSQIARLRAGIYTKWNVQENPTSPNGMEYIQLVWLHQDKTGPEYNAPYVVPYTYTVYASRTLIADTAVARPGSIWLLGNEIERVDWPLSGGRAGGQNEIVPELYAQAYHELYTYIKQHDPTALIAVGGVIQGTPLRLKYLDRVWNAYRERYGQKMPVDIWNVHGFVLREKRYYPGCPDCHGADIPAGLTETVGILYGIRDADNLDMFKQQLIAFRQWMRDKGERDKPLIVTEYGTIMPYWLSDEDGKYFDTERVRDFMYGTFDFMQNATDSELGCPADKNRLVQQWIWYSLDDDPELYSGSLFDYATKGITPLGLSWEIYVNDLSRMPAPYVNLFPLRLSSEPPAPLSTVPVTLTLQAEVASSGSLPMPWDFTVRFYDQNWTQIGDAVVSGIRCCGGTATAQITWSNVPPGVHQVHVRVDPDGYIAESDKNDNWLTGTILVSSYRIYLPLASRNRIL